MLNERNSLHINNNNNTSSYNGNLVISSNVMTTSGSGNSIFSDKLIKNSSDSNMNFIKNGQLSPSTAQKLSQITLSKCLSNGTNNGNKTNGTVKTERLSPPIVNDLSMYR
jgi:hypothetical protein